MQVILKLGHAFTAAAQQDVKSPATHMAIYAISTLLRQASEALGQGLAGIASITASIEQQLKQSGMLQQLSALMTAMSAELQSETAVLDDGGWDAVSGDVARFAATDALPSRLSGVAPLVMAIGVLPEVLAPASGFWDSSGHAVTVMQFAIAGLQYTSSVVRHVLPAVWVRSPQLAAGLLHNLKCSSQVTVGLCMGILDIRDVAVLSQEQQEKGRNAGAWQQLLQSPRLLPCVAAVLVMGGSYLIRSGVTHWADEDASSGGSNSSNDRGIYWHSSLYSGRLLDCCQYFL
jgi:hypothetical protein